VSFQAPVANGGGGSTLGPPPAASSTDQELLLLQLMQALIQQGLDPDTAADTLRLLQPHLQQHQHLGLGPQDAGVLLQLLSRLLNDTTQPPPGAQTRHTEAPQHHVAQSQVVSERLDQPPPPLLGGTAMQQPVEQLQSRGLQQLSPTDNQPQPLVAGGRRDGNGRER
jgi:hypothetical protein